MSKICYSCFKEIPEDSGCCPYCGFDERANRENYPQALPAGTVLNAQYVIGRVLGQGGFGITYIAQDYDSKEILAVKEYFPSANATRTTNLEVIPFSGEKGESYAYGMECFVNEAFILAKFTGNINIANVSCCFKENGTAYYVMEYVDGQSFEDLIRERFEKNGGMSWEEAAEIIDAVLNALAAVHSEGIIHRDIAPDNISIMRDGTVKLLDFGAARYSLGDATHSLDVVLKHGFAPKEQYSRRGKQGPSTDLYAAAATMYYALTGHKPPDAIERVDRDELALPSAMRLAYPVSRDQEEVLLKALAVDSCDRYQSAEEFQSDLRAVTNTPEALYQRAMSTMTGAESLPAAQQVEQYKAAIAIFQQILDMPSARGYEALCRESMEKCQEAIQLAVEQTLELAREKADTDPLQPQADTAYAEALELVGKTAQLTQDEEKKAQCDRIQKTCEANLKLHSLAAQIGRAKQILEAELPAKEKRQACLEAQRLLEEVKAQTDSLQLRQECNRVLALCQAELTRLTGRKRKLWLALAGALTGVVAAIVALFAGHSSSSTPALPVVTEPVVKTPVLEALISSGSGEYLYIELRNADGYGTPKFYVWNDEDTSGEKKCYVPQKENECWCQTIRLADLGTIGNYCIEAQGTVNGESALIASTEILVEQIPLTSLRLSVSRETATISIAMDKVEGYEDVTFAVWGNENAGDDLIWYQAEEQDGQWVYQADLLEHNELGLYFVHAYGWKDGENVKLAWGKVNVDSILQPKLQVWQDSNMQDLHILLEKAGGNTQISIGIWRESEGESESSVQWFAADAGEDGSWTCSVDLRSFSGPDNFVVQVYGRKNQNDADRLIAGKVVAIEQIAQCTLYASTSAKNQSMWVGMVSNAENVRFGVWGYGYGTEDLVFYDGTKKENGSWECVVDLSTHHSSDSYFVHAYGVVNGQNILLAAGLFSLE